MRVVKIVSVRGDLTFVNKINEMRQEAAARGRLTAVFADYVHRSALYHTPRHCQQENGSSASDAPNKPAKLEGASGCQSSVLGTCGGRVGHAHRCGNGQP